MTAQCRKILFIINPISGGKNKTEIIHAIPRLLNDKEFEFFIKQTEHGGHAATLAKEAVADNMDIVVAVGGDGTINEVASQLASTKAALAIVPCGSGNGLARDLGIPLNYYEAIRHINALNIKKIDVGVCNDVLFFSVAGFGFDAKVAYNFNRGNNRKFFGYASAILKDYFFSSEHSFEVFLDDEIFTGTFFFITVANCSQWGYNVKVAPDARLDDGEFTVVLCKKPSIFSIIPFGIKLLSGKIYTSRFACYRTSKKIFIHSDSAYLYHIDGDAKGVIRNIKIDILKKALNVLV